MFRRVQLKVQLAIGQDPWLSFPALPAVYLAGSKPPVNIELAFWTSIKDSTDPALLASYLERFPNGEFVPIARALMAHYAEQHKAEQAVREEERKRREEAAKAAEVARIEEERRAREVALADERKHAQQEKNTAEIGVGADGAPCAYQGAA